MFSSSEEEAAHVWAPSNTGCRACAYMPAGASWAPSPWLGMKLRCCRQKRRECSRRIGRAPLVVVFRIRSLT